ncbi:hypothetical protein Tco_0231960 [Tanacetum coccineum]
MGLYCMCVDSDSVSEKSGDDIDIRLESVRLGKYYAEVSHILEVIHTREMSWSDDVVHGGGDIVRTSSELMAYRYSEYTQLQEYQGARGTIGVLIVSSIVIITRSDELVWVYRGGVAEDVKVFNITFRTDLGSTFFMMIVSYSYYAYTIAYGIEGEDSGIYAWVISARVLFDSGADKSFVSISLAYKLNIPPIPIDTFYNIEMADGNLDYPHRALQNKGIVDSGCSRHITGNKAYLAEYQDFNGGPVAFKRSIEKQGNIEFCGQKDQEGIQVMPNSTTKWKLMKKEYDPLCRH